MEKNVHGGHLVIQNKAENDPGGLNDFFPEFEADKSISSDSSIPIHQIDS